MLRNAAGAGAVTTVSLNWARVRSVPARADAAAVAIAELTVGEVWTSSSSAAAVKGTHSNSAARPRKKSVLRMTPIVQPNQTDFYFYPEMPRKPKKRSRESRKLTAHDARVPHPCLAFLRGKVGLLTFDPQSRSPTHKAGPPLTARHNHTSRSTFAAPRTRGNSRLGHPSSCRGGRLVRPAAQVYRAAAHSAIRGIREIENQPAREAKESPTLQRWVSSKKTEQVPGRQKVLLRLPGTSVPSSSQLHPEFSLLV